MRSNCHRDRVTVYAYCPHNHVHHQSPAARRAFAFEGHAMTQMILGDLAMVAILGLMAWLAYRSETRGRRK